MNNGKIPWDPAPYHAALDLFDAGAGHVCLVVVASLPVHSGRCTDFPSKLAVELGN